MRSSGARARRVRRRALGASVLVFLAVLLVPTSASAHAVLVRTTPTDEVLPAPPPAVTLTFNERPRGRFTVVHVTGPDGARRDAGAVSVVDQTVTQPIAGSRPAGLYTVDWRVVSADGHPISGEYRFTASGPAPALAGPPPAATQAEAPADAHAGHGAGHGLHIVFGVAVGLLLLLSAGVEHWMKRRRRTA
jgi:methionine-rich copper-binding protein CopC